MLVDPQVAQAPELTTEVLTAWIEQAFQQQCPCPHTHDVAGYALYFQAVRARIYNKKTFNLAIRLSPINTKGSLNSQ